MKKAILYVETLFAFLIFSTLAGCGNHQQNLDNIDTTDLAQLESVRVYPRTAAPTKTDMGQLRVKVLQDTAMSVGAQAGLAWSSERMNKQMYKDRKYLDTVFNFNAMMLSHGVIPPVLEIGNFSLNLDDPNTIRVADRTYKIVQQARFATTAPTWRDYLWLGYSKPSLPDKSLLPRTSDEQAIWRKNVITGWQKGIEQSYSIFQQSLAHLKRDYQGMITYRKLLQEKMISPPFVSRTELGITGNGEDMRVNDQVLRIV
ncbi:MAG: type IV secretory system conjugative DNA transfer family protein, partial [Gammaproteobacteria bacterium]|nr:type IV secretory system conjugative DNA transfer family protein [Gammaproteobacteria bacterium]